MTSREQDKETGHLLDDERGTSSVEYIYFLVGVTLVIAAVMVTLGPSLWDLFRLRIAWLSLPLP